MSLPTPPHTNHRSDKENRPLASGTPRVEWSAHNQVHPLSSPSRIAEIRKAFVDRPTKSILKKTQPLQVLSPVQETETSQREETPEPSLPQYDAMYLETPVRAITDPTSSLTELCAAYSTLASRLRACVDDADKPDSAWPLFKPLHAHSTQLMESITRDVGRALVDPAPETEAKISLPSPQKSPRKKRGMSAQHVKHARDLCSTTHCVLKLLAFVFTQPAIYEIFSDDDLRGLLTAILAIPLADSLPTLYARKTCALSIWVLQTQRLSPDILRPAANRIAYAIRRGLDGELGKEGKKGSANDGLKAVHDLSRYLPEIFVPAFSSLLPSIFHNLLGVSVVLRIQACHALGGFALASTMITISDVHEDLSNCVRSVFTSASVKASPSKVASPVTEAPIVRTLRTTLSQKDPQNAAQGPAWAISVLAHCVLLLRSAVYDDPIICRTMTALFSLAKRNPRSHLRALAGLAWKSTIWTYFQPRLRVAYPARHGADHKSYLGFVASVLEVGCGVSLIAGWSSESTDSTKTEQSLRCITSILELMLQRSYKCFSHALLSIRQLVNAEDDDTDWTFIPNRILSPSLYCGNPGVLTESLDSPEMRQTITEISKEGIQISDVSPLSKDVLFDTGVVEGFFMIWKKAVGQFDKYDEESSKSIVSTWRSLLQTYLTVVQDDDRHDVSDVIDFALQMLEDIVLDNGTTCAVIPQSPPKSSPSPTRRLNCSVKCLRLKILQSLWKVLTALISELEVADKFLVCLTKHERELTGDDDKAYIEWAKLSAMVAMACPTEALKAFWLYQTDPSASAREWDWSTAQRRTIWKQFFDIWKDHGSCDGITILLGVPFSRACAWDMDEDDFKNWEMLLIFGVDKALDYGTDAVQFIDSVCDNIAPNFDPTDVSAIRIADFLMCSLQENIDDARSVPSSLMDFVNDALRSGYPPDRISMTWCVWTIRTLAVFLQFVPASLCFDLLDGVQEGISIWISDERKCLSLDVYAAEIPLLYDTVLAFFSNFPDDSRTLEVFQDLLECVFVGRDDKPQGMTDAFNLFWQRSFAKSIPEDDWPEAVRVHFGLSVAPPSTDTIEDSSTCTDIPSPAELSTESRQNLCTPPSSPTATPTRPHCSPISRFTLRCPESPTRRSAAKGFNSPLSRKRRISSDDKENVCPSPAPSSPRKRVISNDHSEGPVSKKAKPEGESTRSKCDISPPKVVHDVFSDAPSTGKRKRVLDCVEVPTIRSLRRSRSLEDEETSVVSFTTLLQRSKRPRRDSSKSKLDSDDLNRSDDLSSDDDPHIGQVTPSHLISPEVSRREKIELRLDSDPPSDDSLSGSPVMGSDPPSDDSLTGSPTKQVAKRKKARYTSLNGPYWAGTI